MADDRWPMTEKPDPSICPQPLVIAHRPSVIGHQPSVIGHRLTDPAAYASKL
jgi:hypothetical protein